MTALTAAFEPARKDGTYVQYPVGASQTIFKGSLLATRGDGYAYPLRAPYSENADIFIGVADETVNNANGSAGAAFVHVWKTGSFTVAKASAALTDIGTLFYGADDATVTATSTNAIPVGYASEVVSGSQLKIRIDRQTM